MINDPSTPTLEDLKKRHARAMKQSDAAVCALPETYRQLKTRIRAVTSAVVDVDAYHTLATSLAATLKDLNNESRGSIFGHFLRRIDPALEGCARYLRMDCRELQSHLEDLDDWRRRCRKIRRVK